MSIDEQLHEEEEEDEAEELLSRPSKPHQFKRKPKYIINHDNRLLMVFKTVLYFITLPNICLNLFFVAFAHEGEFTRLEKICNYSDIVYAVEILLAFFTSYLE
jgi:hypothetical protein